MPNQQDKLPENEPGRYYVDRQCIDCDVCRDIARENFTREAKKGYSFVYKQPDNDAEEGLCREALEACPVEAIGSDGS
jgi:ferredoxin